MAPWPCPATSVALVARRVLTSKRPRRPYRFAKLSLVQLVPAVTELIIAEMLYLQYKDRTKPMYLYINSTGGCRQPRPRWPVLCPPWPFLCPSRALHGRVRRIPVVAARQARAC